MVRLFLEEVVGRVFVQRLGFGLMQITNCEKS